MVLENLLYDKFHAPFRLSKYPSLFPPELHRLLQGPAPPLPLPTPHNVPSRIGSSYQGNGAGNGVCKENVKRVKRKLWCLGFQKIILKAEANIFWANFALKTPIHGQSTSIYLQLDTNTKQIHFAKIPPRENRIFKGEKIKLFISSL